MKSDAITEFGSRQIVEEIGGGGGGGSDAIWKPTVSAQGDISWTRTASTTVPTPQNIKGPQGEIGPAGPQGPQGPQGEKGDVDWAEIKNKPDNLATTEDVAAKVFIAEYNVTTAAELIAYLNSANEPFAPVLVKRGNDYYTAVLATKSGTNDVIVRVMGSGSGDYIIFNYTVRGAVWSSNSYIFQKKLVSGTDIKTLNGESLLGSGDISIGGAERYEVGAEVLIGEWIEGGVTYDLYRKVVNIGELPNATSKSVAHGITNALRFTKIIGVAAGLNNNLPLPFAATANENNIYLAVGNSNINVQTGTDRSSYTAMITIEFTRARA